jgi:hypothetical protein
MNSKQWFFLMLLGFAAVALAMIPLPGLTRGLNEGFDAGAVRATDPRNSDNEPLATEEYANQLAAENSLRYYFSQVTAATGGYELFLEEPISAVASSASTTVGADWTLFDGYITATNSPGIDMLETGVYEIHRHVAKAAGSDAQVAFELWSRTVGGTETFIGSSAAELVTGDNAITEVSVSITVATPVTLALTDRLVLKQYGKRATAPDVAMQSWYGGAYQGYFGVPVSSLNFMYRDGSNASTTVSLSGRLNVTGPINGAGSVASTSYVDVDHGQSQAQHGCTVVASEARITTVGGGLIQGATQVASAGATADNQFGVVNASGPVTIGSRTLVLVGGSSFSKTYTSSFITEVAVNPNASVATYAIASFVLGTNDYKAIVKVEAMGATADNIGGTGVEAWVAYYAADNNSGTINWIASQSVMTSVTGSALEDMVDPTVTLTADGVTITVNFFAPAVYSRYLLRVSGVGYGLNVPKFLGEP